MGYKPTITLSKGVTNFIWALVSGAITAGIGYIVALPPEAQAGSWCVVLALLKMGENYLKHRND